MNISSWHFDKGYNAMCRILNTAAGASDYGYRAHNAQARFMMAVRKFTGLTLRRN
jgi:hypothetical protein